MADDNNRIVNQNSGGLTDLSAIVAAVNALATNTREVKNLLDTIKSSIGNNTSSSGGVTKSDIDKLFKDYVEKGFDALERKIGNSNNTNNSNNHGVVNNRTANDVRRDARNTLDSSNRLISEFDTLVRNSNTSFDSFNRSLTQFNTAINESIETERNRARQTRRNIDNLTANYNRISTELQNTRNIISGDNNLIDRELGTVRNNIRDYTMQINTVRREINQLLDSGVSYDDERVRIQEDRIAQLYRQTQDEAEIGDAYANMRDDLLTQSNSIEEMTNSLITTQRDLRQSTEETLGTSRDSFFGAIASSITNSLGLNNRANEAALRPYDTVLRQYNTALENINRYSNELTRTYRENERKLQDIIEEQNRINAIPEADRTDTDNRSLELLTEQANILAQAQANIEAERHNIEEYEENITAERATIQTQRNELANSSNVISNIGKKLISFLGGLVKDAIQIEAQHIRQAADEIFDSFERLQQSIGKSLKLSSGAYDDFKEQMIQAAAEVGVAVDVTQLNDAAASMAELGIRDTEILKDFAIGANILSESGSTLQLDEDITRQLLASYNKDISSGLGQEEASERLVNAFYDLAAAESAIAENYGSVTALSRGGYQTISQWFNQLQEAGYLQSDQLGEFTLSMGSMLQAMENAGVDSSTLLSDFDTIMQGNFSGLNTELQQWLQQSNVNTKEDFLQAISTNFGDVALEFEKSRADLYKNMDAMSVSYARPAFGSNLTDIQALGRVDKIDEITTAYTAATRDTNTLNNSINSLKEGLENGDWLTATDKLDKYNKQLVDRVAAEAQNLPDGKTIMDKGFEVVNSGINMLIDAVGSGFGAVLTAMTARSLTGAGTTGAGGLGSVGQFMRGASGSAIGTAGRAVGAVAGVGVAGFNVVQNVIDEGSLSAGIEASLTDPGVYSGIGMTLGGVIGGPIGSAIGLAIGYASSTIGNKIADVIVPVIAKDEVAEAQQKAAEELQKAAEELYESGTVLQQDYIESQNTLNTQKEAFKNFDEHQKALWLQDNELFLRQNGLVDYQHGLTEDDLTNNQLFEDAVNKWIENETKELNKKEALSQGESFVSDLGVTQLDNQYTMEELIGNEELQNNLDDWLTTYVGNDADRIKKLNEFGVTLDELKSHDIENTEGWLDAINYFNDYAYDYRAMVNSEDFNKTTDIIKQYQEASNISDFEEAARAYYNTIGGFNEEQADHLASLRADIIDTNKKQKEQDNLFIKNWNALVKDGTELTYSEAVVKYNEQYASDGINIEDYIKIDDSNKYNYAKPVENSHASGLYYVPYDEYPAILHEGEMILDSNDADRYRTMLNSIMDNVSNSDVSTAETYGAINNNMSITNDIDISPIKDSVDNQTNSVTDILNKILTLLMGLTTNAPSYLPKSLVQMDSNLNRL